MPKISFTIDNFAAPVSFHNTLLLRFKNLRWRDDAGSAMYVGQRAAGMHREALELAGASRRRTQSSGNAATSTSQLTQNVTITSHNTNSSDLPHIHISLINATNSNDTLLFYASSLELSGENVTEIHVPISEKCHTFFEDVGRANLAVKILYQDKLEKKMRRWALLENEIRWDYHEELRLNLLREQQKRRQRKEILSLNATRCHDTTCTIQRDHLGQCNDGKFFIFEDIILDPFDEIEYEVAKEGKCKGSIQMVMVTKRYGEVILCETPIFSTGNWQQYHRQQARLEEMKRKFLCQYFFGAKNLRCEKTTLGFYFLGSYGICNIRSVRFYKFLDSQIRRGGMKRFCDVDIQCQS